MTIVVGFEFSVAGIRTEAIATVSESDEWRFGTDRRQYLAEAFLLESLRVSPCRVRSLQARQGGTPPLRTWSVQSP